MNKTDILVFITNELLQIEALVGFKSLRWNSAPKLQTDIKLQRHPR